MAKMPQKIIDAYNNPAAPKMLATLSRKSAPNLVPLGPVTVLDDETIAFADILLGNAKTNLDTTKRAAITVYLAPVDGYQMKGLFSEWQTSGPLYDQLSDAAKNMGIAGGIRAVGLMKVAEGYSVGLLTKGAKVC